MIRPRDAILYPERFILENTVLQSSPLVPEIKLHLASEMLPLWSMTEEELDKAGLPPPYWAFAWAGGQALTRYILDHPDVVRGKRCLDFASGSGLCAIAAMKAGAMSARANDVDPLAITAAKLNAEANKALVWFNADNLVGEASHGWDVVLAGDICYEQPLAGEVEAWLKALATDGALVLLGDPGRTYLPKSGLEELAVYQVETTRELEDNDVRRTTVWRVLPEKRPFSLRS